MCQYNVYVGGMCVHIHARVLSFSKHFKCFRFIIIHIELFCVYFFFLFLSSLSYVRCTAKSLLFLVQLLWNKKETLMFFYAKSISNHLVRIVCIFKCFSLLGFRKKSNSNTSSRCALWIMPTNWNAFFCRKICKLQIKVIKIISSWTDRKKRAIILVYTQFKLINTTINIHVTIFSAAFYCDLQFLVQ